MIGSGFDCLGRETVSFIDGEFVHPHPWSDEAMHTIGCILKDLHQATASFATPHDAIWRPWFGRSISEGPSVIGHCDTGSWNIVARDRSPIALIDWEEAGPVARDVELAQACWLNAQLVDDDVAERIGLGSSAIRAKQVSVLLDGYGLSKPERAGFFHKMLSFAIHSAADQAIQSRVTPESHDVELYGQSRGGLVVLVGCSGTETFWNDRSDKELPSEVPSRLPEQDQQRCIASLYTQQQTSTVLSWTLLSRLDRRIRRARDRGRAVDNPEREVEKTMAFCVVHERRRG